MRSDVFTATVGLLALNGAAHAAPMREWIGVERLVIVCDATTLPAGLCTIIAEEAGRGSRYPVSLASLPGSAGARATVRLVVSAESGGYAIRCVAAGGEAPAPVSPFTLPTGSPRPFVMRRAVSAALDPLLPWRDAGARPGQMRGPPRQY